MMMKMKHFIMSLLYFVSLKCKKKKKNTHNVVNSKFCDQNNMFL